MGEDKRPDVYSVKSERKGLGGFIENLLREFKIVFHLVMLAPLYMIGAACIGAALLPGFYLFTAMSSWTAGLSEGMRFWMLGCSLGAGYFMYGFSMIVIAPTLNFLFRTSLKEWRGPYYSLPAIRWYIHNGLTYVVRYTFLEFITPTPFNLFFFRMMGMKIGEGTMINTSMISDPSMIEMGRKVTLGGSVTIVAHYGQGGFLVLAPVKIGDKATIGLRAILMGGVTIGEGAKILPNSVVLPKTQIPAGETWGGVPARKIEAHELAKSA
jgi:Carbonic anhydrases/acetyltransferases, isoleucine patch superfamily